MHPLEIAIGWAWIAFWIYWLASAAGSKHSVRGGRRRQLTGVSAVGVFVIAGVLRGGGLAVQRDRRGAEPHGHLPGGVPGVQEPDEDAHPVLAVVNLATAMLWMWGRGRP
jgi:hypothetical protein